jgi:superfamily II DNA or RNA helicase
VVVSRCNVQKRYRHVNNFVMQLRSDQLAALDQLREAYRNGYRAPLFVAPTGYGKTVCFAAIATRMTQSGKRVVIVCHRAELLRQIRDTLQQFGVTPSIVVPGEPAPKQLCIVASAMTLINRLATIPAPDLAVLDEAHHATLKNTIGKIRAAWAGSRWLGVTATPVRLSGEALGDIFDVLVVGPSVRRLIDASLLADYRIFAPPTVDTTGLHRRYGEFIPAEVDARLAKPSITGDVIEHYRKHADGKRAIVFCASVKHARAVADCFAEAGVTSASIDGSLSGRDRSDRVADFQENRTLVLTSCDLVSEGFDVPGIECGIFLRPTASQGLWIQQMGRCLRQFSGKSHAVLLDHVGNTTRHGLPDDEREWSLYPQGVRTPSMGGYIQAAIRVCLSCFAAVRAPATHCTNCGRAFPVESRQLREVEGRLTEVDKEALRKQRQVEAWQARSQRAEASTLEDLRRLAQQRGYKPGWAEHVYRARQVKYGRQ